MSMSSRRLPIRIYQRRCDALYPNDGPWIVCIECKGKVYAVTSANLLSEAETRKLWRLDRHKFHAFDESTLSYLEDSRS